MNLFLIFTLILLIRLWYLKENTKSSNFRYYLLLSGYTILTIFSGGRYLSVNNGIFSNADYYFIQHQGFKWKGDLFLASDVSNQKIWDNKLGNLIIRTADDQFVVEANEFYFPFYMSADTSSESFLKLMNPVYDFEMKDSLTISDRYGNRIKMKIEELKNRTVYSVLIRFKEDTFQVLSQKP